MNQRPDPGLTGFMKHARRPVTADSRSTGMCGQEMDYTGRQGRKWRELRITDLLCK